MKKIILFASRVWWRCQRFTALKCSCVVFPNRAIIGELSKISENRKSQRVLQNANQFWIVLYCWKWYQWLRIFDNYFRPMFKSISKLGNEKEFVLDCDARVIPDVLKHAQQVGMMTSQYSFFITSLVRFLSILYKKWEISWTSIKLLYHDSIN